MNPKNAVPEELSRRRRRKLAEGEVQGLTIAQKLIWYELNNLLPLQPGGYCEGSYSYADIAFYCGFTTSTVITAIKALVDAGLVLQRRRHDFRGKRGPYFAANTYRLLPPPSVRTPKEEEMVAELRKLWQEDERLPKRRPGPRI